MSNKLPQPNYTQVPNLILDNLPEFSDAEMRIIFTLCRNTFGWHKEKTVISIGQLQDATGMSRQGVVNGIKSLIQFGYMGRTECGDGFEYFLILEAVNAVDYPMAEGSQRRGPVLVNAVDRGLVNAVDSPIKERNGKKELKKELPQAAPGLHREFTDGWIAGFKEVMGRDYTGFKTSGAKEGVATAKLMTLGLSPNELLEIARKAWARPMGFYCKMANTIHGFMTHFEGIRTEIQIPPPANRITNGNGYAKNPDRSVQSPIAGCSKAKYDLLCTIKGRPPTQEEIDKAPGS